jgi:hypothetical protein
MTAIPFNAINNDEFLQMCEAIGQFGPGFQPPSQKHVRGPLLTEDVVDRFFAKQYARKKKKPTV